jgi:hypothetical protein
MTAGCVKTANNMLLAQTYVRSLTAASNFMAAEGQNMYFD